ncbi:MAG: ATP-dependent exonuclease SbcCD, C subunit-like protein [Desulfobulbaceae bacterium]|nr:ATP-dependent exonuclease SbcCD, C subunit-like protein [Desulfobulbaceae bacterium]
MIMQPGLLDFSTSDQEAGFRLDRFEFYNWGTFDEKVWQIEPLGFNSLLTGDIGSGKSTLVDALVTLLVPQQRIVYNKAAGAGSRERTLYSYVRGEYKSEKDDLTQAARAVALRGEAQYSVLLARFHNRGLGLIVTLAQVFWLKPQQNTPERFFVVAEKPLSIAADFSNFGTAIADLRRQLRRQEKIDIFPSFKEYANRFRHLLGIDNEQALNLFFQTVSMKSVGNLTDFVRQHMLEKIDMDARLTELRRNFDNLNQAHDSILKAKTRIEQLTPLVKDCLRYQELATENAALRLCRDNLYAYFYSHKVQLLDTHLETLALDLEKIRQRLQSCLENLNQLRLREAGLRSAIDDQGGRRLEELRLEIERLEKEKQRLADRFEHYNRLSRELDIPAIRSEDDFVGNLKRILLLRTGIEQEIEDLGRQLVNFTVDLREAKAAHEQIEQELSSLRSRRSNIPRKSLEIRRAMAEAIDLSEDELPFVGELIQAAEDQKDWEGAIERLLHNFGLSLLVSRTHYTLVNEYVERTNLRGRLVYYRVNGVKKTATFSDDPNLLPRKLRIRPDTPFYDWLEQELYRRFNYVCCRELSEFQRLPKALTVNGLIKSGGSRHEKDDRHGLMDRSRFVLGWSNEEKIEALEKEAAQLTIKGRQLADKITELQKQKEQMTLRRDLCRDFSQITEYADIDWQPLALTIEELKDELRQLEESSDQLRLLRSQLDDVRTKISEAEQRRSELEKKQGGMENEKNLRQSERQELAEYDGFLDDPQNDKLVRELDAFRKAALEDNSIALRTIDKSQTRVREYVNSQISNADSRLRKVTEIILKQMGHFKNQWSAETGDMDTSIAAAPEYQEMLDSLIKEDLPRHEARFKQLLNEGTINSIALFQNQLDRERQDISDKISSINLSLKETDYNPGTYIILMMDMTQDPDIREFQQELKACLSHSLGDDELYNEAKFLQVKKLIDRFNGREGFVDLDRRWTMKVTDVRNWFTFSAIERWTADDRDREYYSDSSGKSGGQKEKLAYTILASALAYQFGLEWGAVRSRSFRFVVIDEAFGKGSDESTRYGLELFKRLNLQLLIVTPLQKIQVIENYINAVHFVHNEDGRSSQIRNLTIEEYHEEKSRRRNSDQPG